MSAVRYFVLWKRLAQIVGLATMVLPLAGRADDGWPVYAHDQQHSCISSVASELPQVIRWSKPVDLDPQYSGNELFIHYGSPVITGLNTVVFPVKT